MTDLTTLAAAAARRVGTSIGAAGLPPDSAIPTSVLVGTLIAISGSSYRVDSNGRQLDCIALAYVNIGDTVYVLRSGEINLILGGLGTNSVDFPGRIVASGFATPAITGIGTTPTVILSVAFTALADRWYYAIGQADTTHVTTAGNELLGVHDGAGNICERTRLTRAAGDVGYHTIFARNRTWSAGAKTWSLRFESSAGTISTNGECSLTIFDGGPA